ncbi:SH3 domain-containing protein [Aggregatilinea lenta]|uniref:SH3 domain-containing protein n=1 Tax=Aggregatilinea lenta TaxID=913108 RepID=UPI000E5A5366|nr:SH3 domain-containing protein [Aggregatilinea lenta]
MMKQMRRILAGYAGLMLILAACNMSTNPAPQPGPTVGTPLAWATTSPNDTITPASAPPDANGETSSASTIQPAPSVNVPTKAPLPTHTPDPLASVTAAPTLTPPLPSTTPAPTLTAPPNTTETPIAVAQALDAPAASTLTATYWVPLDGWLPTAIPITPAPNTPAPDTSASSALAAPTQEVFTPSGGAKPSATPVVAAPASTNTPVPPGAVVCDTCDYLRLRDAPGTGSVIMNLSANAALTIIGKSQDGTWVQVITDSGVMGWVATEYLVIGSGLDGVAVAANSVPTQVAAVSAGPVNANAVSGVSSHARAIFLYGRSLGNSAYTFTRVGDSISAAPQFLTQIGAGNYSLGDYSYLGGAIRFFSGPNARGQNPFAASSIAARNGWGTTSVLDPSNADGGLCRSGETPLACEYRVVKPSVALIMFGTNDSGGLSTLDFQANMHEIVQISINMGVIPVLSTIPPKHYNSATDGRVAEFNQVIIATAQMYDVPLWDYGQVMRSLSGEGLASDGVHPSTPPDGITTIFDESHLRYGYTARNLTALHVLWTLWQQVLYDGNDAPTATPSGAQAGVPSLDSGVSGSGAVSCPGTEPVTLIAGGTGRVTPGLPNKLRSAPSTSASQIGSIPGEAVFSVISGPQCADGLLWYQVNYQGATGWTATGTTGDPWIEAN